MTMLKTLCWILLIQRENQSPCNDLQGLAKLPYTPRPLFLNAYLL